MVKASSNLPNVEKYFFYSEVANDIQTGDLLAWRINKITSIFTFLLYFYQVFFKATYSHTAIAVRLGDQVFAVEATSPTVRMMPLWMLGNFYLYRANVQERKNNVHTLLKHLGKNYSLFDMIKNMFQFGTSDEELYCAEQCHNFYEEIGYFVDVIDEDEDDIITPDKVVKKVVKQSGAVAEYIRIDKGNIHAC